MRVHVTSNLETLQTLFDYSDFYKSYQETIDGFTYKYSYKLHPIGYGQGFIAEYCNVFVHNTIVSQMRCCVALVQGTVVPSS